VSKNTNNTATCLVGPQSTVHRYYNNKRVAYKLSQWIQNTVTSRENAPTGPPQSNAVIGL